MLLREVIAKDAQLKPRATWDMGRRYLRVLNPWNDWLELGSITPECRDVYGVPTRTAEAQRKTSSTTVLRER